MPEVDHDEELVAKAIEFAEALTHTVHSVLGPDEPAFEAVYEAKTGAARVVVRPRAAEGSPPPPIAIRIKDYVRLQLTVQILCAWDRDKKLLAVAESKVTVRMTGKAEPLFRWEFLHAPGGNVPSGHFQIHAHRDEAV
ncbi:MAG TPA: hypothetical protein VFU43_13580 [Streptosporangiaceae bacterium]|nr:hypothetical protein [Streptosporangiaceae bacterium]